MPHTSKLQNEATEMLHNTGSQKRGLAVLGTFLLAATLAWSQPAPAHDAVDRDQAPPPPAQGGDRQGPGGPGGGPGGGHRQGPPPQQGLGMRMPPGMWWTNPDVIQKINLSTDQQKKISDIFQQFRLKLIDADASVRKEEAIMEPLVQSETPEDSKILAQIDKVASARAELEKTDARMLLGIRHVLTPEQWKTLQSERPQHDGPPRRGDGNGPPRGPRP
jgi:Spy/CpxP family protein refolding chaperone